MGKYPDIFKPADPSAKDENPFFKNWPSAKLNGLPEKGLTLIKLTSLDPALRKYILSSPEPGSPRIVDVTSPQSNGTVGLSKSLEKPQTDQLDEKVAPTEKDTPKVTPQEEETPTAPVKHFMWNECKYSENLDNGEFVNVWYIYNVDTFQVVAEADTKAHKVNQVRIKTLMDEGKLVPLTQPPIVGEIVIAEGGFRCRVLTVGRVDEIKPEDQWDICVEFVDYGDSRPHRKYNTMFHMTQELMEVPIYSVKVHLDGIEKLESKIRPGKRLENLIYEPLQLQIVDEFDLGEKEEFGVILWMGEYKNLNDIVARVLTVLKSRRDKDPDRFIIP